MKILVTGNGKSGSWEIRGRQLGEAIGAEISPKTYLGKNFDTIIVVKRPLRPFYSGQAMLVWDIVDSWPQPVGNDWNRAKCMDWLRAQVFALQPDALVAATGAMADDCAEFDLPILVLPHHARPGIAINPIRERVRKVGYEGGVQYITKWRPIIEQECHKRGWEFVMNPAALADIDIVVALRDQRGYAPQNWKSNVKLANAQASGTPCIVNYESGYCETACGAELFADSQDDLSTAFDALVSQHARRELADMLILAAPRLTAMAERYRSWLYQIAR